MMTLLLASCEWFCSVGLSQQVTDTVFITAQEFVGAAIGKPETYFADTSFHISSGQVVLPRVVGLQMQSIAPGGLTTILHRGHGHRHLAVLWEGINIQNPINGTFDLNLLPLELFQSTGFNSFSSPVIQGINAMAGSVLLMQDGRRESNMGFRWNSMQNYLLHSNVFFDRKLMRHHFGVSYRRDNNKFRYRFFGSELDREGGDVELLSFTYKSSVEVGSHGRFSVSTLLQDAVREVPVSITSQYQKQIQKDKSLRLNFNYVHLFDRFFVEGRSFMMTERLEFNTPIIYSKSDLTRYGAELTVYDADTRQNFISARYRFDKAKANFYIDVKTRTSINLSTGRSMKVGHLWDFDFQLGMDLVDYHQWLPNWYSSISFRAWRFSYARSNNLPGFNDLYWPGAGRTDLKPENSDRFQLAYSKMLLHMNFKALTYASIVDNWILWNPGSDGFWYPENQKKVFSRGVELSIDRKFSRGKIWNIRPQIEYAFNKTTVLKHYFNAALVGKRLIYTPLHRFSASLKFENGRHSALAQWQFTSTRYSDIKNLEELPAYDLCNLLYSYKGPGSWHFSLGINNLLGASYEIVPFYPMPGRNIDIGIQYFFNINKT